MHYKSDRKKINGSHASVDRAPRPLINSELDVHQAGASATVTIKLPAPLYSTFQAWTIREQISLGEAVRRIVCGLSGLTDVDLWSLPEPPRRNRDPELDLKVDMQKHFVDRLLEAADVARMTPASIFCRILYALLITQDAHCTIEGHEQFCIQLSQMHFEFPFSNGVPRLVASRASDVQTNGRASCRHTKTAAENKSGSGCIVAGGLRVAGSYVK